MGDHLPLLPIKNETAKICAVNIPEFSAPSPEVKNLLYAFPITYIGLELNFTNYLIIFIFLILLSRPPAATK
jgi:hypothetical protein